MCADRSLNVIDPFFGTPYRPYARSSMAISSVSTFHDHKATPAASVSVVHGSGVQAR